MTEFDSAQRSVLQLSRIVRRWAETTDLDTALHDIVHTCCSVVPCHSAAIGVTSTVPTGLPVQVRAASQPGEFEVLLEIVARVPGSPGVLAARDLSSVVCPDLRAESRPALRDFAVAAVARTQIRATAAFGLQVRGQLLGVLNVYFAAPLQEGDGALETATALADHVAMVIDAFEIERRAEQLEAALQNSRLIGAAIGILVERHRITKDAAFEVLRATSQNRNRKLVDVAEALVRTGSL